MAVNALDATGAVATAGEPTTLKVADVLAAPTLDTPEALTVGQRTLTGTGAPGTTVQIVVNGQPAGTAVVGPDGKWTFDADFPAAGDYAVAVNALDASGAVTAPGEPTTLKVAAPTPTPAPTSTPSANIYCDYSDPTVFGEDQGATWLVDRCDTMSYIARQTGIPLADLIRANPQVRDPNLILPGWRITLPGR